MRDEKLIIKCPYCGAEYLPCEIFYPEDFLTAPKEIVRDEDEHIVACSDSPMNLEAEYTCYKCNHTFKVIAEVSFKTEKCEQHDFDNDFVAPLYNKERTELKED